MLAQGQDDAAEVPGCEADPHPRRGGRAAGGAGGAALGAVRGPSGESQVFYCSCASTEYSADIISLHRCWVRTARAHYCCKRKLH